MYKSVTRNVALVSVVIPVKNKKGRPTKAKQIMAIQSNHCKMAETHCQLHVLAPVIQCSLLCSASGFSHFLIRPKRGVRFKGGLITMPLENGKTKTLSGWPMFILVFISPCASISLKINTRFIPKQWKF